MDDQPCRYSQHTPAYKTRFEMRVAQLLITLAVGWGCSHTNKELNDELLNAQMDIVTNDLNSGRPHAALAKLKPLRKKYPENNKLTALLGVTHLALKNFRVARKLLEQSHHKAPNAASALNLSSVLIELGETERARQILVQQQANLKKKQVTYNHPERLSHNIGFSYEKERKFAIAQKHYEKALETNPLFYLSHYRLGQILEKLNKPGQAQARYKTAVQYCRKCFEPTHALALNLLNSGQNTASLQLVEEFLKHNQLTDVEKEKASNLRNVILRIMQREKEKRRAVNQRNRSRAHR